MKDALLRTLPSTGIRPDMTAEEYAYIVAIDRENFTDIEYLSSPAPGIIIFRAKKAGQPGFLKLARNDNELYVLRLRSEWNILEDLNLFDVPNIPIPLLWLSLKDISGIFYSDSGYRTMRELYISADGQTRPHSDADWLLLMKAIRHVCRVLHGCHSRNIRHGNIRPDAIAINHDIDADEPKSLVLGSWFYASRLAVESAVSTSAVMEASLSYIAPECTGRMNRSVDLRADLYSLGVTLYEVISGKVPFQGVSKLEIMHKHMSQIAEPLSRFTSIPEPIELLVSKLMMKNLEDRYQSAAGLLYDVEKIIQFLTNPSSCPHTIIIGQDDHASKFVVSRDFVGRETEVQTLLEQYEGLQSDSRTRVATIAGYSGVGKSRLVQEVLHNICQSRIKVFYAECKFDQYKSFAPFAIMSTLVRDLLAQIFVEPPAALAGWRDKVKTVLGSEAQSVVELCPDVAALLTPEYLATLPSLVPLGAMASEERLTRCLRRLIQAFASRDRQLVVFVDDIQWSPPADLSILLGIREQTDLFLLCAYRDNEVGKDHIVKTIFLNNIAADVHLMLQGMSRRDATTIIAATLCRNLALTESDPNLDQDLQAFVDLIYVKTQGNAFFITQALTSLHNSGLLHFDFAQRYWIWDISKVQAVEMPEDVIGLVLRQLADLSPACLDVLKIASCLGNTSFRLDILEITTLHTRAELAQNLLGAMSIGLVLPVDDSYKAALTLGTTNEWVSASKQRNRRSSTMNTHQASVVSTTNKSFGDDLIVRYRFLHDKVQQAVYALIAENERAALQLRTGLRLLHAFGEDVKDSMLFDICSQIFKGRSLLEKGEYPRLARLNLRAAKAAYHNSANETALMLLSQVKEFMSDDVWHSDTHFAELYYELMEGVQASLAAYDEAVKAAAVILDRSQNLVVKTRMHGRQMKALMSMGRTTEAIATGVEGLTGAGIHFEKYLDGTASASDLVDTMDELWKTVPSSVEAIHQLRKLPIISDELMLAGTDILINLFPPLYLSNPGLAPLLVLTGVMTSIEKGVASYTSYFMDFLGMLLCEIEDPRCNFVIASAWNRTADFLLDELLENSPRSFEHAGASLTLSGCIHSFTRDPRLEGRRTFTQAIELSQRCFDGQYLAYSVGNQTNTRLFSGENLMQIFGEIAKHIDLVRSYKQIPGMLYCLPTLQTIYSLMHCNTRMDALKTSGHIVSDMDYDRQLLEAGDSYLLHSVYFWCARLLLCLVLQDQQGAIQAVISGKRVLHGAYGVPGKLHFETMASIVLFEQRDQEAPMPSELETYLPVLCNHIEGWALQNPRNYQCWQFYIDAESNKKEQGLAGTLKFFETAIQAASNSGNFLLEALFNERCARYLARLKLSPKVYLGYVTAAVRAYQAWGSPVTAFYIAELYDIALEPKWEKDAGLLLNDNSVMKDHTAKQRHANDSMAAVSEESLSLVNQKTSHSCTDLTSSGTPIAPFSNVYEDHSVETDLDVVIKSSLLLTSTLNTADLVRQLLGLLVQVAGAQYGALITDLDQNQKLSVAATYESTAVRLYDDFSLDHAKDVVPVELVRLVANSRRCIIDQAKFVRSINNKKNGNHSLDHAKSFMALPVLLRDKTLAVAYLSNDQVSNVFTTRKVELLTILAAQAAAALEKSKIYNDLRLVNEDLSFSKRSLEQQKEELEEVVQIRTAQLRTQNDALFDEIQQRKNVEKELVAAKDTAEKATAMKSRFLAMMSHEMRTPFNAVIGFSSLLLDTRLSAEQQDMAQSIVDSSTDLIAIINDILDFSKIENDKMNLDPVWFDMRSLIESTLEIVSRPANVKDIALAYLEDASTSADWIFADNSRMRQCVLNLLSNAVKFTPDHGTVSVSTKLELMNPSTNDENQQGMLTVAVYDTGIGIAKQDQDKLFQFFSQVDDSVTRRFGGTGLGLAISHKICHLFGGDLTCDSEEGKGSTFTATFSVQLNRRTHQTEKFVSAALTGKTCLILEPSELLCSNLQQHLDIFGVKHVTRSRLEAIEDNIDRCDFAIIGDHFNQPETIVALRKRGVSTSRLPLVVLMPFGATLPQQPSKKDLQSIDAVVSSPVRRVRLFRSLESLYPDQTGVCAFAKPTMKNLKTITSPGQSFPRKDISILLVEDNLVNVKVATQLLKRVGYVPRVAHDGIEAVAVCASEHFDLIFMDLSMPRMGGIQATREIRKQQAADAQKPYICAMTANAMSGDQEKCIEAGMDDYITKPVLKPKLHAVLDKVRDMVVGTIRGHNNIEHIDHSKQVNSEELEEKVQTRRQSIQEQHGVPDFSSDQNI